MVVSDFNSSLDFGQSTFALSLKGLADALWTHCLLTTAGLPAQASIRSVRPSLSRQSPYKDVLMFRPVPLHDICTDDISSKSKPDRGYRGHDYEGDAAVYKQDGKLKQLSHAVIRNLRSRSAIEPTIGHVKSDNRMVRNYLKSAEGARLNAILSAGYNMRKLIAAFSYAPAEFIRFLHNLLSDASKSLCW
jgi:hypothetical protein